MSTPQSDNLEQVQRAFREMEDTRTAALKRLFGTTPAEERGAIAPPPWTTLVERVITELAATGKHSEKQRYLDWIRSLRNALVRVEFQLTDGTELQAGNRVLLQLISHTFISTISRYRYYVVLCHLLRNGQIDWAASEESKYTLALYAIWQQAGKVLDLLPPEPEQPPSSWPHWRQLTPQQWLDGHYLKVFEAISAQRASAPPASAGTMDPYEEGEIPVCLYTSDWGRADKLPTRCLCTPPPIWQDFTGGKRLTAPEFVSFLDLAQIWKEPHLLVRHGAPKQKDPIDYLERDYKDTFHLLQLPRDGEWATQTGTWADLPDPAAFKKQFLAALTGSDQGYQLPVPLRKKMAAWAPQLLDALQTQFFKSHKQLTPQERRQLIELAHLHLIQLAIAALQPVTWNAIGRTRLDGGQLTHLLICLHGLALTNQLSDPTWGDRLEALTWGPYLESDLTPPSPEEVQLTATTGKLLITHAGALPALWKQLSAHWDPSLPSPGPVTPFEKP